MMFLAGRNKRLQTESFDRIIKEHSHEFHYLSCRTCRHCFGNLVIFRPALRRSRLKAQNLQHFTL